ncbi:phosphoribosylanthranilate isomerase [Chelatococcus asaccharovorans]|uniref:phosphoribosylanthranilate isomerase n=1 Tax=Chelatococcus asaccharovorans TaxID=28210 RepID=UPI00224C6944|nr:phosphoribosylanthranilate isomerase [Chelatococcus asaccharovorans]CAH1658456.1 N-(5'-phosphoribosyl)anthranilate isomerase [Chelatococcus asaccharovorans]CAH1684501.1 N-(5'-phosphoribosyl)anthranilate isomerase [Chelatococcus asaccharovorans]
MTIIKICGLSTPDTLAAALDSGADMVGLVFFPKSPRRVDLDTARFLADQARGRAAIVALTVDADDALIEDIVAATRPDLLQLHGHETAARVAAIKARFRRPVMKAVGIAAAADVAAARDLAATLLAQADGEDRILLDAKPPKDAALPGGNGLPFDRNLVVGLDLALPFMVSGGLDPASVAEAIRLVTPWGVDVSSGVERAPGVKDPARIEAFIKAARAACDDGGDARGRVA